MFYRVLRSSVRISQRGARQYHDDKSFRYPSMDELPIPQGSWQAQYDSYQKKYNFQLIGGLTFLAATLAIAYSSGALYMNAFPPEPKTQKTDA